MPTPGEGRFQRRILRALKEHGWPGTRGRPCLLQTELREIVFGRRRPGWTYNWTLERALRALEVRGRVSRHVVEIDWLGSAPAIVVVYERNMGIPGCFSDSPQSD